MKNRSFQKLEKHLILIQSWHQSYYIGTTPSPYKNEHLYIINLPDIKWVLQRWECDFGSQKSHLIALIHSLLRIRWKPVKFHLTILLTAISTAYGTTARRYLATHRILQGIPCRKLFLLPYKMVDNKFTWLLYYAITVHAHKFTVSIDVCLG